MDEEKARELERQADELLRPYMGRRGGNYILSPEALRKRFSCEIPHADMDEYSEDPHRKLA